MFAALNTLDGSVMATCMERHRHQEWLKFLRLIDCQTPADKELHCEFAGQSDTVGTDEKQN